MTGCCLLRRDACCWMLFLVLNCCDGVNGGVGEEALQHAVERDQKCRTHQRRPYICGLWSCCAWSATVCHQQQRCDLMVEYPAEHSADAKRDNDGAPACDQPTTAGVDPSQPVVFQVGKLGRCYWTWVNSPEPGKPRFFRNSFAEACSKVKWWVVPLIWVPFFSGVLRHSQLAYDIGWQRQLAWVLLGLVAWQGLEYTIHRCVFHHAFTSYWGLTFHFLFHGCHHKYPMDGDRLVFPPLPASWFISATYLLLTALLPMRHALPMFAGMGYGYVAYDCLHYAIHHSGARFARRLPFVRELQTRHLHHHYRDHTSGYGISSILFDVLLGTSAKL